MTIYTYSRRPIGSCKARVPVRGADSAQALHNAIALYQRPILVHSGPAPMRQDEDFSQPWAWPWVRLDTASGVPTRLDDATFWPMRSKGAVDISLRLIGMYQMSDNIGAPVESDADPATRPTIAPVIITSELCQYLSGTSPTVLASAQLSTEIVCYPNVKVPWYPLLSLLALGTNDYSGPGYDKNLMATGSGGVLRVGQLYPQDLGLLQRLRTTIDFDNAVWSPDFTTARGLPVFVRVTCIKDPARSIQYDPQASTNAEHIRIFCVGSEMRLRGVV